MELGTYSWGWGHPRHYPPPQVKLLHHSPGIHPIGGSRTPGVLKSRTENAAHQPTVPDCHWAGGYHQNPGTPAPLPATQGTPRGAGLLQEALVLFLVLLQRIIWATVGLGTCQPESQSVRQAPCMGQGCRVSVLEEGSWEQGAVVKGSGSLRGVQGIHNSRCGYASHHTVTCPPKPHSPLRQTESQV